MNYEENLNSLRKGITGIGKNSHLETIYSDEIPVAEVKSGNRELRALAKVPQKSLFSRTSLLALIAAGEAVERSGIRNEDGLRTGLISASTVGGMDRTEIFFKKFRTEKSQGRIREVISHDVGDHTEAIASAFGIREFVTTISTACSSSANSILLGARLIENGILDRVIAGGSDALTLFTLNGFNSLMILDKRGCMPFDDDRNGLTLGEGAAYLVLESETAVTKTGKKGLCVLTGYGNACDAFHQTASSPEGDGAYMSMDKALGKAGMHPDRIDYINAHGTGTKNNDLSEGKAVERLFKDSLPPLSSTKSYTGHTLGAAGAIEAVFSVMAIEHGCIWPGIRFISKMKELSFEPVTSLTTGTEVRNVMSNSFGFGGNNTSLIFSKC
ncbi:MAG: beta-ketoacyl-[acyl-carrier-protein] synthase family protein [Bacteroidales bacterium]|nr:beta-ketoacyl-[acyl-carrier-protein] synthase family protein [Bacteroidales bacterium]